MHGLALSKRLKFGLMVSDQQTKKEMTMSESKLNEQIKKFDELQDSMHEAEKNRTLEEQVAYLKSQGIDPSKSYAKWDDDQEEE